MSPWQAWIEGMRRVVHAPGVILRLWLVTLLLTLPLGFAVHRDITRQLGSSLVAAQQVAGVTDDWLAEFGERQNGGISATLGPQVIGFAAVVDNASALVDATPRPAAIGATVALHALAWIFLAGGLIQRLASRRPISPARFFLCCGRHAPHVLRLSVVSGLLYAMLMTRIHPWLLGSQYDRLTGDLDAESTAFAIRVAFYGLFVLGLAAINLWFDFAKIRLVLEHRRSVFGALRAAARTIRRSGSGAAALYLLDAALLGAAAAAYAALAPGAGSTWLAFAVGQVYVAARIAVKLTFWASEAVWFQEQSRYTHLSVRPTTEAP